MTKINDNTKIDMFNEVLKNQASSWDHNTMDNSTTRKTSNLILKALQQDKGQIDCWDAFVEVGFSKALWK